MTLSIIYNEKFAKIVSLLKALICFGKSSIKNVWQGIQYKSTRTVMRLFLFPQVFETMDQVKFVEDSL